MKVLKFVDHQTHFSDFLINCLNPPKASFMDMNNWHHFRFFDSKHFFTFYMQNAFSIINLKNLGDFQACFNN
jgi:hypothetical protein